MIKGYQGIWRSFSNMWNCNFIVRKVNELTGYVIVKKALMIKGGEGWKFVQ